MVFDMNLKLLMAIMDLFFLRELALLGVSVCRMTLCVNAIMTIDYHLKGWISIKFTGSSLSESTQQPDKPKINHVNDFSMASPILSKIEIWSSPLHPYAGQRTEWEQHHQAK
jgi:hypothetical protein